MFFLVVWFTLRAARYVPAFSLALMSVAIPVFHANAADAPMTMTPPNSGGISFQSVGELAQDSTGPRLGNAEIADPTEWRASFYSKSTGHGCTSTLIGPQTLLTAAHCVGPGQEASIKVEGVPYSGACIHHPDYPTDPSADYALCRMTQPVPGVPYESINTNPKALKVGMYLRLTGFGCVSISGTGPVDDIYRVGNSPVTALPGELPHEPNSIITTATVVEDAILCRGDSGGPAFIESDMSSARVVASVNSRVSPSQRRSYMSSLTTDKAMAWIKQWSDFAVEQRICGLPNAPDGCR
ncbi:trypsin-like serine protease [Bradyrhizobium genosp. A]|uniref:trypsin-like serine protease n=1 Tax=Bradyrhizobium genosp. A TaxID=83626 RepID=UPI003CE892CE